MINIRKDGNGYFIEAEENQRLAVTARELLMLLRDLKEREEGLKRQIEKQREEK